MSSQNLISATLSEETKTEITQALTEVRNKLEFLLSMQPDEIKSIFKAGNGFIPFIDKAYNVVNAHPEILPSVFNVEEFKKRLPACQESYPHRQPDKRTGRKHPKNEYRSK